MPVSTVSLNVLPRIIVGVLLPVLLAGCSALRLTYNNATSLTHWWLDGYVSLSEAQADIVRADLAALHAWHRQQEVPAYADLLHRMQQLADGPVTPELVCTFAQEIRMHWRHLTARTADGLTRTAPTLQEEQLRQLVQKFEQTNRKWREEWLDGTPAELLERRVTRTVNRYEDFYGRLGQEQKNLLRQRLATSGFDARVSWSERLRRQRDMLRVFQEHRGADRSAHVKAEMLALVQRSVDSPDPAYRQQFDQLLKEGCETLAAVHNSASAAQRRHLIERLHAYETDLRELSARP